MGLLDNFDSSQMFGAGGPGDPLIALGMGLLSQRGVGRGLAQGFQNVSDAAEMARKRQDQELARTRQATLDKLAMDRENRQAANDALLEKWRQQNFTTNQQQQAQAQQNWQKQFEASNAQRAAELDLQKQNSARMEGQANKPVLVDVPQPDGTVQKTWVSPTSAVPGTTVGAPSVPSAEKPTEAQSNAALFARRMTAANDILSNPEIWQSGVGKAGVGARLAEKVPIVGNMMLPKEYQQLRQAQEDFLGAVLRKESGAAISNSEYEHGTRQYFPQPGDSPEVIAQKEANRQTALTGILGASSPVFQKQFAAEREKTKTASPSNPPEIEQARAAIAKGAPRDAVIQRLREHGIDAAGL